MDMDMELQNYDNCCMIYDTVMLTNLTKKVPLTFVGDYQVILNDVTSCIEEDECKTTLWTHSISLFRGR